LANQPPIKPIPNEGFRPASLPLPRHSSWSDGGKMPVDGPFLGVSRLLNLV
jgi:hypothetical protein